VTPNELIHEIRQYLSDEIATCVYTSYHFEHSGKALKEDQPELIQAIPDVKDGTVISMVEGMKQLELSFFVYFFPISVE
jgi:hypothetical protein